MSDNPTSGQTPTHRSESSPAPQTAGSGLHCSPFIRAFTQPLTAWEDPRHPSLAELFWADAPMVETRTAGDAGRYALCRVVRRSGARFMGLRLRDGTLIVKVVKGRRWAQIRVVDGDAFDPARSGLEIPARTERTARGVRTRVESLDSVGL